MKTIITAIICICTVTIISAQSSKLSGNWSIYEFTTTNNNVSNTQTESDLKEEKAIWDLIFMDENKFKQSSNMRTGNIESHFGTWKVTADKLILNLIVNDNEIQLEYGYEIANDVLVLNRNNPSGSMKIISKFRRKV